MIVSGFTLKKSLNTLDETTANLPGQHSHCVRCRQVNCSQFVDNVTACVMVTCESCGWRCHECKQSEHVLTCPEERVPCVNKEYGCPHVLKRSKMSKHLPVCPASVVCCVEEWSRWPMYAREEGTSMPLPKTKTYMDCGQLDVGLAMRDQRMLIDSLRAPRKLRRTLRNSLTRKYPAAPLTHRSTSFDSDAALSGDTSQTVSDDDADTPWDLTKPHPGLKESIRSRLFRVTKETTDSLAAALELTSTALTSSQTGLCDISESGDNNDLTSAVLKTKQMMLADSSKEQTRSLSRSLSPGGVSNSSLNSPSYDDPQKYSDGKKDDKDVSNNHRKSSSSSLNVAGNDRRSESLERNIKSSDAIERASHSVERSMRSSVSSDRYSDASTRSKSTLHDVGGTQLHKLLGYQPEEGEENEIFLHKLLGVSVNFECINKYVSKPSNMYTYICSQNFRRDEYRWHFKNIHQEIHPGLSGWLEQRCPLAYLGCTFSFNRLEPAQPNSTLYHSWLQESFGLRSDIQPFTSSMSTSTVSASKPESALHTAPPASSQLLPDALSCKENDTSTQGGPSISDLANIDKDFDMPRSTQSKFDGDKDHIPNKTLDKGANLDSHSCTQGEREGAGSTGTDTQTGQIVSQEHDQESMRKYCMRVKPTIYTATNWNSRVLFQYDVEEEADDEVAKGFSHSLVTLPFEVLQQIAKHLDSFSLCNLALTSRLLREVCCSLLDDHGIVVLNWQRHTSDATGEISWKIANKRWLFSTSFEPIRSWKFTDNHPTIGDHLKVCPFNKDIVTHTQPIKIIPDCLIEPQPKQSQ